MYIDVLEGKKQKKENKLRDKRRMKSSAKEYFGVEKFIPKANLRGCYLDVSNQAMFVGSDDISIVQSCLLERTHCQPSSFSADS